MVRLIQIWEGWEHDVIEVESVFFSVHLCVFYINVLAKRNEGSTGVMFRLR